MTEIPTNWYPNNGNGVANSNNYNIGRTTQDGRIRVTQTSLVLILNPVSIVTQIPTTWTDA